MVGSRLLPPTGAWCWRRKANRQRHNRHLKNSAGFIGDPFTALCGDRVLGRRKRRISRKVFLLSCWSAGTCGLCAKRRAIAFLSAHGAEALSGRRTPPRDGDQTWERPGAHSVGKTAYRGTERHGPADPLTAERIYERRWASTLLDRVLSRLEDTYRKQDNPALFDSFNQLLGDDPGRRRRRILRRNLG